MSDEPGFTIGTEFYPFPSSFRLGDPVLVGEVTGIGWNDFAEMLDSGDPRTLAGLVAVAVWQKHPSWRRERVLRYVEALEMDALEFQGEPEADEGDPPTDEGDSGTTANKPGPLTPSSGDRDASAPTPDSTGLRPLGSVAA